MSTWVVRSTGRLLPRPGEQGSVNAEPMTSLRTREITLHIGGVYASKEPVVVRTVLGSCISVCLIDPLARIGGMNHFMLPADPQIHRNGHGADSARFGVHAMELLIGAMQKLGADRRRLTAKVFGGGSILKVLRYDNGVPQQNIRFINWFLQTEQIRVISQDVGGHSPRHVRFHTETGRALVRTLAPVFADQIAAEEQAHQRQTEQPLVPFGEIELFE